MVEAVEPHVPLADGAQFGPVDCPREERVPSAVGRHDCQRGPVANAEGVAPGIAPFHGSDNELERFAVRHRCDVVPAEPQLEKPRDGCGLTDTLPSHDLEGFSRFTTT